MSRTTNDHVLIPRRLLEELVSYLEASSDGEDHFDVGAGNGVWTPSMLRRLLVELDQYPAALETLDEAAKRAGTHVSLNDLVEASTMEKRTFQSHLGSMSKASTRLFGRKTWPFVYSKTGSGTHYRMDEVVAEWWSEIRNLNVEP